VGTALEHYQGGQIKKHEIGRYVERTGNNKFIPETEKKLYCFY